MSFVCLKQSITDFVRRGKKMKDLKKRSSVDAIRPHSLTVPGDIAPMVDECDFLGDLHSAYHASGTLDIRRAVKNGLNKAPGSIISVFSPPEGVLGGVKRSNVGDNLSLQHLDASAPFPRTPLLPSTPVFEDSFIDTLNGLPSPCTPSLTFTTPLLSTPTSDASAIFISEPRTMRAEDFQSVQFLSKGVCGQVHLVRDRISDRRLALKVIRRADDIFKLPVVKGMLAQEKNIMVSLQGCEWFVQLEASWYDSNNVYFAMLYYPTDLESEIIRCEKLPADRARFYMVEMIIALEELHKRGIVHRDIKAANILVRADGHIVLADFGLSKDFGCEPTLAERSYQPYWPFRTDDDVFKAPHRSPTELTFVADDICGSEVEMAPEIIFQEHYSFGVDFWAATITLYLMVTGRHPWSDEKEKMIQDQIIEDDIEFAPEDHIGGECQDFIRQMLKKEPAERLRIGLDMTSHPYFAGIDWVAAQNRTVTPPWVPDFVSGHCYYEEWGAVELFEPGQAIDKDQDDFLPDFFFTSPELQPVVETPLGDFFSYVSEDEAKDDTCSCDADFENDHLLHGVILPTSQVTTRSPTIIESDSYDSVSASFHSASSLVKLIYSESLMNPAYLIRKSQKAASLMPNPEPRAEDPSPMGRVVPRSGRGAFARTPKRVMISAVSVAEPIQCTQPVSRAFRPTLEPVMESVDSMSGLISEYLAEYATSARDEVQVLSRAARAVTKVACWLKNLLP